MIQLDMLIIELKDSGRRRASAKHIANKLQALHDRCLGDSDFATGPQPWMRKYLNPRSDAVTVHLPAANEHCFDILPRGVTDHFTLNLAPRIERVGVSDTS
jgi:hypothetical protein